MSRISARLQQLAADGRKAVVPYIVAGDPNPDTTVPLMRALVAQGADIVELGVPFSDPMAEGPVIQLAHERALMHHVTLRDILAMVAEFRCTDDATPVVLMGYANPIERIGYAAFAQEAAAAGVDGVLIVDMPPEEAADLTDLLKPAGIDMIFLLAPTTTDERIAKVAELASGYLYCVSLKGVTGAGHLDVAAVEAQLARIKAITDLPVTVGFGIKDAASAAAVARVAEGVVIGSALVERVAAATRDGRSLDELTGDTAALIGAVRRAVDAL